MKWIRRLLTIPRKSKAKRTRLSAESQVPQEVSSSADRPSPAHHLPADILLEIFEQYIYGATSSEWIRITHVCRYWRDTALSYTQLWSVIPIPSRLHNLFLERSGEAPLTVRLRVTLVVTAALHDQLTALVDAHRARITHLDLQAGPADRARILKSLGETYTSRITLIDLKNVSWTREYDQDAPFIAGADKGRLASVSLHGCAFSWESPLYYSSGLTTLELREIPAHLRPNSVKLFEMLPALISLRNLVLEFALPPELEEPHSQLSPISLPNLASLRVKDNKQPLVALLASLDASPTEFLSISCPYKVDLPSSESPIVAVSSRCSYGLPTWTRFCLVMTRSEVSYHLGDNSHWFSHVEFDNQSGLQRPMCEFLPSFLGRFGVESITFIELHCTLPLAHSREQMIDIRSEWSRLSSFSELRVLKLVGRRPHFLMELLFERAMLCIGISMTSTTGHFHRDGSRQQVIENLETIHFFQFEFDPYEPKAKDPSGSLINFYDLLTGFLWALQRNPRCRPPTIIIEECTSVSVQRVAQLRQFTDVEWDNPWGANVDVNSAQGDYFLPSLCTFGQLVAIYFPDTRGRQFLDEKSSNTTPSSRSRAW